MEEIPKVSPYHYITIRVCACVQDLVAPLVSHLYLTNIFLRIDFRESQEKQNEER